MAKIICIAGESGSGKTTSMRNLPPKETLYIDCDKKGLSWKGWKKDFNGDTKNYLRTDFASIALNVLRKVNFDVGREEKETQESFEKRTENAKKQFGHIKFVVIDTLNGLMVADEMRRTKKPGYDKWQDLAQSIYDLVDYALTVREDVTIIFVAHTQTDRDDSGYMFTRIKTSGKKLDKIVLESKFTTVLIAECKDGKYIFHTHADRSTAKTPLGAFDDDEIENDIVTVIKALEDF